MASVFTGDIQTMNTGDYTVSESLIKEACVAICSYESSYFGSSCARISMTDSISAGCPYAGFIASGYECGLLNNQKFTYNVAHSIDGVGSYMYADPSDTSQRTCMEVGFFFGYKNKGNCLTAVANTQQLRVHDINCIDNVEGLSLITGANDVDNVLIALSDSKFYGESLSDDCPDSEDAEECICEDRAAIMLFTNQDGVKPLMPTDESELPIYKPKGIGNWGGITYL